MQHPRGEIKAVFAQDRLLFAIPFEGDLAVNEQIGALQMLRFGKTLTGREAQQAKIHARVLLLIAHCGNWRIAERIFFRAFDMHNKTSDYRLQRLDFR